MPRKNTPTNRSPRPPAGPRRPRPSPPVAPPEPAPVYELRPDPLDPGWVLFEGLRAEMRRQLAAEREAVTRQARLDVLRSVGGPSRPARPGRVLLAFDGDLGAAVPAGLEVLTDDATRRAVLTGRGFRLRRLIGVDVAACGLAVNLQAADGRENDDFCGLLWALPAALSVRVRAVRLEGRPLRWVRDDDGRLFVPPQPRQGGRLEVELPLGPGDERFVGRPIVNVQTARTLCDDERPIPPATFVVPGGPTAVGAAGKKGDRHGLLPSQSPFFPAAPRVTQPFAGRPARLAEDEDAWERRVADHVRHRGRAVSPDDYRDLLRDFVPDACLLDVSETRVRVGGRYRDAVRLTLVPRTWERTEDLLARSLLLADRVVRLLAGRVEEGVVVLAGPPSLVVAARPASDEALWLYRDFLVTERALAVCRRDRVWWPVRSPADVREVTP